MIETIEQSELAPGHLFADLTSEPPASRRLWCQEIYALDILRHAPSTSPSEVSAIESIIADRRDMLEAELAAASPSLNARIRSEVHHQLRARPDFQTGRLVTEQWVPAINYWLVCGTFDLEAHHNIVIAQLLEGDPRVRTPDQRLAAIRDTAEANRVANEQAGTDKVASVIDNMSATQIARFLEVERGIKQGETIVAHGSDEAFLESSHQKTVASAAQGDRQAQNVLGRGVADTDACVNPGHNPIRR